MTERTKTYQPEPSLETMGESLPATADVLPVWPARSIFPGPGSIVDATGKYRLLKPLGTGGFGSVHLAEVMTPPAPDVPPMVAIKFFQASSGRRAKDNASREFSALLGLRSPHIPRAFDGNLDTIHPFFVFQYYSGGSLASVFEKGQALGEPESLRVLNDLLEALVAAHGSSLLHLDIKPQNILVDDAGSYTLADFGLNQAVRARSLQGASPGLGTFGYRAPELVRCAGPGGDGTDPFEELDVRTDLWALGATVWALAAGINLSRPPANFPAPPPGPGIPNLTHVNRNASALVQELIRPLLADDPRDRPGSAAEVLAEVRAFRAGEPSPGAAFGPASPKRLETAESVRLLESLADPLWRSLCDQFGDRLRLLRFHKGEVLCRENAAVHHAFVLLRGSVAVSIRGRVIARESFEGTFLGEVSTLTGLPRTATVTATEESYVAVFNAAELEEFLARHPAVCLRLLKLMAKRQFEDRTLGAAHQ